jgi:hypothetical protein
LHQSGIAAQFRAVQLKLMEETTMLTEEIKEVLKTAFDEVVKTGGEIGSRREFYVVNLGQTIFSSEDEAREFVKEHETELNKFFATLDPNYLD